MSWIKLFYGSFSVEYRCAEFLNRRVQGVRAAIVLPAADGHCRCWCYLIYLLLTRTRVGIVILLFSNPSPGGSLQRGSCRWFMAVFGIGAARAGLAGALAGAFYTTNPNMALELGVIVFVVVVVGGLGSMAGAMVASLLIRPDHLSPWAWTSTWRRCSACLVPVNGRNKWAV